MVLFLTFTFGCARVGVKEAGPPTPSKPGDKSTETRDADLLKEELSNQISSMSAKVEKSPNNILLLRESAQLYLTYGFLIEDVDPKQAEELYTKGREYGLRALKQDNQCRKGLESGKSISQLVGDLNEEYKEALCWTGLNGGLWLILNMDDPSILSEIGNVISVVKRSIELDETYFYGIGKVFMGAYYALVPTFLEPAAGPENSARMFQEARSVSDGKFLLVDLFEARFLATKLKDQDLFQKRLNAVLSGDAEALKDANPINRLSKMKADYYLKHQGKFFPLS
jgi:hypothetical protein